MEARRGKRGRRGSPESWDVDAHVGERIRIRRMLQGFSQGKLGESIGLTFQQVQKYERGSNRISAGMLYRLAQALDVPVSYFFDCYEGAGAPQSGGLTGMSGGGSGGGDGGEGGALSRREARMLRLWREAPDDVAREVLALLSLVSSSRDDDEDVEEGDETSASVPALAGTSKSAEDAASRRRRRPGAVWDPSDVK